MPRRSRSRSHSPRRRRSRSRDRSSNAREDRGSRVRKDRHDDRHERQERKRDNGRDDRRGGKSDSKHKFNWGKDQETDEPKEPPKPKEKANLGLSGKLAEDTNMYKGVLIKYSEPANARIPKVRWRLYPFKGDEPMKPLFVHRQSGYLIGRDRKIADIPLDHPSISKQHAVLQYRQVELVQADDSKTRIIRPYVLDLESANGTFLNGSRIDSKRYVELKEKDVLKFGFSTREYVVLSENTNAEGTVDEVQPSDSDSDPGP